MTYINPNWHPARIVEEDEPTVMDTRSEVLMITSREQLDELYGFMGIPKSHPGPFIVPMRAEPSPHLDMLRTILRDAMSYNLCRPWCEQDDIELERKCQAAIDSMALLRESLAIDATEPPDCDSGVWAGDGGE